LEKKFVLRMDPNAGESAKDIEPVRQILKLNQLDAPVVLSLSDDRLKSLSGVAVTPSRVMVNDMDLFHWGNCAITGGARDRAHSMPCGSPRNSIVLNKLHEHIYSD